MERESTEPQGGPASTDVELALTTPYASWTSRRTALLVLQSQIG